MSTRRYHEPRRKIRKIIKFSSNKLIRGMTARVNNSLDKLFGVEVRRKYDPGA